jgi:autotransporter strand-loop-strand O-heptosyltransferase
MKEILIKEYNNLVKLPKTPLFKKNTYKLNFIKGCRFEVLGDEKAEYSVNFINRDNGEVVYENIITNNMWCKTNIQYFVNYQIEIKNKITGEVVFEHLYNAENQNVYIHLASNALGDTLSWMPHLEEFRKIHKCNLTVSTFHNKMFNTEYPDIKFIEPGIELFDLYAMYEVGWHYGEDENVDYQKNPLNFRKIPLAQTATDILGLDYKEIKPKHTFKNTGSTIDGKYVCIAPHASSHAKYWNREGGWQKVIDYLNYKGYKVVMITQEPLGDKWHDSKLGGTLTGVIDKTGDHPLSERANDLMNADAFIGLGSGLSWLSWAVECPTVLISGFSEPTSEFEDCERISSPKNKCGGCFNTTKLDAGDWEWCPEHKNSSRQFECTKSIHHQVVIDAVKRQLIKFS